MLDDQDERLIEKKLEGLLSEEEELIFNKKYQSDNIFKQEVISQTEVLASIAAIKKDQLKKDFKVWLEDKDEEINVNNTSKQSKWYLAVAAVILTLLIALALFFSQTPPTSDELFMAYFEPIDNIISSRNDAPDTDLNKGVLFYERREYDSARHYLINYHDNPNALIYLGISELALGDAQESIGTLTKVKEFDINQTIVEYVDWFTALAYIQAGDRETARSILQKFKQLPSSDYHEKAIDLLEDLQ